MAKLSQIKLGTTTYDIGAKWDNISGKPSSFTPSSHTHSYLPLSGGTLTGTVNSSGNMNLYGSNAYFSLGTSSSSSKCYFQTYNATTPGTDDANLKAGFGFGWSNSLIIDKSGNITIPGDLTVSGGDIAGKASSAKVADAVAWDNITGKPSSFPPSSHTHSYLPLSGGTLTGGLTISNGADLNLQAPSSNTSDSGDLVFKNYSGTEIGRIWLGTDYFQVRFGPNDAAKILLTSGNYSDYAATKNHNHDSAYVNVSGDTMSGLLNAHGGISLNSSTPQQTPAYILGIKAFAEGGNIIWQSAGSVSVGYADRAGTCDSLNNSAGSSNRAIWFNGGQPAACNDTLNHNISGNAATATLWALTGTANTTTGHSDWDGGVGNTNKYTVYDQEWACSSIGADTGDLRVFLRPGEYSSGGTEVCFAIDGDYYVMGNKVLHAGNYNSYAATKSHTHTISQVTWGASENLVCTGDNSEWSVDMQSSAPNSYFHIWSGYLGNSCMTFSNKTGKCHAPYGVSGAVWNDYAEYRNQLEEIEPGYCVTANDKGEVFKTSYRLQACDGVVSDTFGFSIGETENAKTPLAVAGRVLVYCGDERSIYHFGDCVCAGPNGFAYKMTEEEIQKYPHRIIGTVSEIPEYEIWGTGNISVNNRIWIKVK